MQDEPETVQWLLDFVNLGSERGKLNIPKLETRPRVKRTPTKPPPGIMSLPPKKLPHRGLDLNSVHVVDDEGNRWVRSFGETEFLGKKDFYPSLKEFKDFFLKWGIFPIEAKIGIIAVTTEAEKAPDQTKEIINFKIQLKDVNFIYEGQLFLKEDKKSDERVYPLLKTFWKEALKAFHHILRVNGSDLGILQTKDAFRIYNFCISRQEEGVFPFSHDGTLPFALYAYILDLWITHKEIHSRLKQCLCCGVFWIAEEERGCGRPQTFCSEKCENVFNSPSRSKNKKASRDCKKQKSKKSRRDKETELINHFKNRGQTLQDAEVLAREAMRNGETIEDYSLNK